MRPTGATANRIRFEHADKLQLRSRCAFQPGGRAGFVALDPCAVPRREITGFDVRAGLCDEIEIEMQIVDRQQRATDDFAGERHVP